MPSFDTSAWSLGGTLLPSNGSRCRAVQRNKSKYSRKLKPKKPLLLARIPERQTSGLSAVDDFFKNSGASQLSRRILRPVGFRRLGCFALFYFVQEC